MDNWLKENVVNRFILTDMSDHTYKESGKTQFFKGDLDWVVSHPKGLKNWLQSFGEKIVLAASGGTYDWVVFRTMMRIKYVKDMPEYIELEVNEVICRHLMKLYQLHMILCS